MSRYILVTSTTRIKIQDPVPTTEEINNAVDEMISDLDLLIEGGSEIIESDCAWTYEA